ncbi:MAG: pectate lyase precursor [Polyangiaceae bacterium]
MTSTAVASAADLPAFPGAEGFGAKATGGRGGQVIKVTTLASSGPGSLQSALAASGPRIVVFEVSGVIVGDHTIEHGDVTIAGQTAPGAGITIAGRLYAAYDSSVTNIVVRHLRVRPEYQGGPGEQFDALQFSLSSRVMLDHISFSGGIDENLDVYEAKDVTLQWSTDEASAIGGHPEGAHNYGFINGPDGRRVSIHHTLFAHHKNRCPAIANGPAEVRNNVIYNVRHGFVHHNPASGPFNIVGNVYIQGPNDSLIPFWFDDEANGSSGTLSYYLANNYVDDPGDFVGVVDDPWLSPPLHPSFADMYMPASYRSDTEHDFAGEPSHLPVTTQPCDQAEVAVLDRAGAFPRDVVTLQTLSEVARRTGAWDPPLPDDLLAGLVAAAAPVDADDDGMADVWEVAQGLDPSDGSDHGAVMPSGYTAIEDYINGLAAQLVGDSPGGGSGGGGGSEDPPGGPSDPGAGGSDPTSNPPPTGSNGDDTSAPGADTSGCQLGANASPPSSLAWLFAVIGALARRRRSAPAARHHRDLRRLALRRGLRAPGAQPPWAHRAGAECTRDTQAS